MMTRRLVATTMCCVAITLAGCGTSASRARLDRAIESYHQGDYRAAREDAGIVLADARSSRRYEAAYIAGISAYQLGYVDEADRRLSFAIEARDDDVRARAKAMLGQIRIEQQRYEEAEELLTDAAADLDAEDAREARELAAKARAGSTSGVRTASSPAERHSPPARTSPGFALQAGAFRERPRAEATAQAWSAKAEQHALGRVRIIPQQDDRGRTLHVVQFGSFSSRFDAKRVRDAIGDLEIIVAPQLD